MIHRVSNVSKIASGEICYEFSQCTHGTDRGQRPALKQSWALFFVAAVSALIRHSISALEDAVKCAVLIFLFGSVGRYFIIVASLYGKRNPFPSIA